jgi:hypothetical protein
MSKARPSITKRRKEEARKQRQREKEARRAQRAAERETRAGAAPDEDPDIAGIVPGPQPLPWENESPGGGSTRDPSGDAENE